MAGGIYFTKMGSFGKNKQLAELTFSKGLNVLTGASNTGKSYVVQCLDYILGSGIPPKPIQESRGYDRIRAELLTCDGRIFTLERMFSQDKIDNYIYVAECPFELFDQFKEEQPLQVLYWKHDDRNEKNLSRFLLKLIGLDGKKLRVDDQNHKKPLSFRHLANFIFVDETRIIDEMSPIYSGQYNDQTLNKSLFKLLLTGEDDDSLVSGIDLDESKSKIRGKLELLNEEITSKNNLLEETQKRCHDFSINEINVQIEKLVSIVHYAFKQLEAEEGEKAFVGKQIGQLRSELNHDETLLSNFLMLQKHYDSDINRLEFINEGKQGLDQLEEVNCPLCNSLIDKKILEPYTDKSDFLESVKKEYTKEKVKKEDLSATLLELTKHKEELELQITDRSNEYQRIDSLIANRLKPVHDMHHDSLEKFLKLREDKKLISILESEIVKSKNDIEELNAKLKEKSLPLPVKLIPEQAYKELSNEIKKILVSWGIVVHSLYYDQKDNDIVINGDKRLNSGKGLRAIYLSAFMIGVMVFCLKKGLNHPSFLLLDAPLTSYKQKDRKFEERDKIPEDVPFKFYESLITLPELSQMQIIVIENEEPDSSIIEKVKYQHFTGNELFGRPGFYPLEAIENINQT
jgi:hypothetical protein